MLIILGKKNMQTQDMTMQNNGIDPVVDFRTPRSLFEDMHSGLSDVVVELQDSLADNIAIYMVAQSAQNHMDRLSDMYDSISATTRGSQVHSEDKEFLQKMIDRINSMIEALEGNVDQDAHSQDDAQESLQSAKAACYSFRAKISF